MAADLNLPVRRRLRGDGRAVNVDNVRTELDDLPELIREAGAANYPQALLRGQGWILEDPVLVRLFDRLMNEGTPLGQYVNGRMYYGIKTGLNKAFVIDQATRDALIAADPRSAEVIKPWLRGRDIKRWRPEWAGLYVIAIQNSGDRDAANAWGQAADYAEARRIFAGTYPAIYDHLCEREFALRPRADQGRYWWELRACAYYAEFAKPKVLWPENNDPVESNFAYDDSGFYTNNKAYLISGVSLSLCSYLNSPVVFWLLDKIATKLRGGWLELRSENVVGTLPVPSSVNQFPQWAAPCEELHDASRLELKLSIAESELIWDWYLGRQVFRSSLSLDKDEDDPAETDDGA